MKSDIEIARAAAIRPITEIADLLKIPHQHISPYGNYKAKVSLGYIASLKDRPDGKLILMTAMSPTPAGEGKTTTTVGLGDGLNRIGKQTVICLREPSLGPCFGMKGGAAGGGMAQVIPMEDINLHFTGDFHAIAAANNLLSALIDNHVHWGNGQGLDSRRITWRRVMDMNDRALRKITVALGGVANGYPREGGFDIVPASEVMAIFCLAEDLGDLMGRLANIIVGYTSDRTPVRAADLNAHGSMAALLKDALAPNLVQTLEGNPAFVHGGPFGNIAHGCNSIISTKTALKLADYVVTEAGFGADLGAEKFFNIKCRKGGLKPAAAVIVATIRALKMHGGVARGQLTEENVDAVRRGCSNLARHIRNIKSFGVPSVVAINRFTEDTDAEIAVVMEIAGGLGEQAITCDHWARGSQGTVELATHVADMVDKDTAQFSTLYEDSLPLWEKIELIATRIYGAREVQANKSVRTRIKEFQETGFGHLPVCMAKTQYSFSTDPLLMGAPSNHSLTVRDIRLSAGAEFLVAMCGDIMTMPGLPRHPAAEDIRVSEQGEIEGLF